MIPSQTVEDGLAVVGLLTIAACALGVASLVIGRAVEIHWQRRNAALAGAL